MIDGQDLAPTFQSPEDFPCPPTIPWAPSAYHPLPLHHGEIALRGARGTGPRALCPTIGVEAMVELDCFHLQWHGRRSRPAPAGHPQPSAALPRRRRQRANRPGVVTAGMWRSQCPYEHLGCDPDRRYPSDGTPCMRAAEAEESSAAGRQPSDARPRQCVANSQRASIQAGLNSSELSSSPPAPTRRSTK